MKAGHLIAAAIEMVIKVVVIAAAIIFIFRGATGAYEFGYRVFADEPMSVTGGRTITVGISEAMKIKDIAKMLEEKGLIEDANLFIVQERSCLLLPVKRKRMEKVGNRDHARENPYVYPVF